MDKTRVLFVCTHNSARSQMAEAFLNKIAGDRFEAHSAGLEPGKLNPLAVEVMKEAGIDISKNRTKSVYDMYKRGELFRYVITVCDESEAQKCPIFPSALETIHWGFEDPAELKGHHEENINKIREIRDRIKAKVEEFVKGIKN